VAYFFGHPVTSVNWTLQTKSQYIKVIWILISLCAGGVRHLYYNNNHYTLQTATFAFHNVVRRHYSGEVGEFRIFLCEISSGYCTPKIIEIDSVFTESFKN